MIRKTWALTILLILPSFFLYFGNNFNRAWYAADPDYIYLMNAINLARGKDAGHIDNPGTPVMEIGAGLLYIQHLLDKPNEDNLQDTVLKDPGRFIKLFRQVLILLIVLALIFTGFVVFEKTGNIWSALIFQITPFLSVNVLEHSWTKVSPEPVLLFVVTLYAGMLAWYFYDKKGKPGLYLVLFCIFGGLGLATKATFLPILLIPYFLLRGWKNKLYYTLGFSAAFFFFTSPAHKEYHSMFEWFGNLISHKGIYGGGEPGIIDFSVYFKNIVSIIIHNMPFSVILGFSVLTWIFGRFIMNRDKRDIHPYSNILLSLITANIAGILIVAKHYSANHYLLPELALSGVTLFFSLEFIDKILQFKFLRKGFRILILLAIVILFLIKSVPVLQQKNTGYKFTNREYKKVNHILDCSFPGFLRIYHYPDGLNKICALKFGNGYSKMSNREALKRLYPETYFLNVMTGDFQLWETHVSVGEIIGKYGKNFIITGRPLKPDGEALLKKFGIYVDPFYTGKLQAIYRIDSLSASNR